MYFQMSKKWSIVATICGQYLARPLKAWPPLSNQIKLHFAHGGMVFLCPAWYLIFFTQLLQDKNPEDLRGPEDFSLQRDRLLHPGPGWLGGACRLLL